MSGEIQASPILAPEYALHRKDVAAVQNPAALAAVPKTSGMNFRDRDVALVQVVPSGGANPTVQVMYWSEAAGQFVNEHTPIVKTGVGANTPYEFEVAARGRILYVGVTAIAAGVVDVHMAGYNIGPSVT
jgi:hypothetical protein